MGKKSNKSENQKNALIKRRNVGLSEAESNNPGFSCQGVVGEFIGYYLRCEVFATKLQHYYQSDKDYKKIGLNTKSLTEALSYFQMHFDNEILIKLFQGGAGKRGTKSARQLRNGYLHQLSKSDRDEIECNGMWAISQMKKWLSLRIKT